MELMNLRRGLMMGMGTNNKIDLLDWYVCDENVHTHIFNLPSGTFTKYKRLYSMVLIKPLSNATWCYPCILNSINRSDTRDVYVGLGNDQSIIKSCVGVMYTENGSDWFATLNGTNKPIYPNQNDNYITIFAYPENGGYFSAGSEFTLIGERS